MPPCSRCGRVTPLLSRLTLHVDTDQRDRETLYEDLCPTCVGHLLTFLEAPHAEAPAVH